MEYRCAHCGGTFESDWTDDEAKAELDEQFPGELIEDCAIVCDDCYKVMFPDGRT